MTNSDAIVLGAGIVGTSVALQLAKRGLQVTLLDREPPGEATSYGNAGIIEGNTVFPPAFPSDLGTLVRVAFKRAGMVNYHLSFLPRAAHWLWAFRAASHPTRLEETARAMRPLFSRAVAEHESLAAESGTSGNLRRTGWLKVYRSDRTFAALKPEFALAAEFGIDLQQLDPDAARVLEPALRPVFRHAVLWPGAASIDDPLALTRSYAARFETLGGTIARGDARTLRRSGGRWEVDAQDGGHAAEQAVVALGPWAPDLLEPLGIVLPLGIKRGYHQHFRLQEGAALSRPVLDADVGYAMAPMRQGLRLTTGAEFAHRDAPSSPVQLQRVLPRARELLPLGASIDPQPWRGARPCFPDSRPVIGPAPGQPGLWLAVGHAHWGLTLGPITGRLMADLLTVQTPFCDPAPYRAERFS